MVDVKSQNLLGIVKTLQVKLYFLRCDEEKGHVSAFHISKHHMIYGLTIIGIELNLQTSEMQ